MTYGEYFAAQRWEDVRWVAAPEKTPNGWLLWLGVDGPGSPGLSSSTRSDDEAPGRYRIDMPVTESIPLGAAS